MKLYQTHPVFIFNSSTILTANILLYLRMLQQSGEPAIPTSIRLTNADSGEKNSGSGNSTTGAGSAGAGHTSGSDDEDTISNPSADLVNNTGDDIRISDFENAGIAGAPKPDPNSANNESSSADAEAALAASPGGTGETRIVGGSNNENIDWDDVVDDGTGEADAATG